MNKADKNKIRVSRGLILVIFILIATAVAFKMYNPKVENEVDFFSKDVQKQISVELRNNQHDVSETVRVDGATVNSEESGEFENIYLLRVNHTKDVTMRFKVDVISADDGMDEALNMRIYDETHDVTLYEGNVRNADGCMFEEEQIVNAAKKNDTRYRVYFYFKGQAGEQYKASETEVKLEWSIPEDQTDALKMSKTGDVRIILYSFIVMVVITVVLLVIFRKRLNPAVFDMGTPKEEKDADYLEEGPSEKVSFDDGSSEEASSDDGSSNEEG